MNTNLPSHEFSPELNPGAAVFRKLLVPLDGSRHALKALHYAIALAGLFDATVHALQVVESVIYPEGNTIPPRSYEPDEAALKAARGRLLERVAGLVPREIRRQVMVVGGHPVEEMVDYAKREQIDLLIVTTHGRSGVKRFLMGSSAEQIIRHAPCPVLVVRDKEHEFA